ncbi:hypothetical protein [Streptomyces rochei]|uniref:hypothetical protein n=1 Tax=Streptomyces rochei TaxID=1928 RepID=UPI0013B98899|nr:hypothetical protein [Streptomyces rochei]NEC77228.1 hypothetical protein [Streptomyces rochei]
MTAFTRGFRLHLADGRVLDGAAFPSGRTIVVDDPEFGLATVTTSVEVLLQGYHGARIEWDDEALLDGQPRPTADSITSDQLDALLLKAAALARVRAYLGARLDQVAVDPADLFNLCLLGARGAS